MTRDDARGCPEIRYVLPLGRPLPANLRWASANMVRDACAYQHWPWPWADLDAEQRLNVQCGVAGHCSRTALQRDGTAGLHADPVGVEMSRDTAEM